MQSNEVKSHPLAPLSVTGCGMFIVDVLDGMLTISWATLAFAERITFRALTLLRSLAAVESSESEAYQPSRLTPNHAVVISGGAKGNAGRRFLV